MSGRDGGSAGPAGPPDGANDALLDRLGADALSLLRSCGAIAAARDERAYLVGGSVRDLLLGRSPDDLDVVVEGDGMAVAQALSRDLGATLLRHHAFQTATVSTDSGQRIDVATARSEQYPRPGQLPQVVPGNLEEDLWRRDFTINTMAVPLADPGFGKVMDPCGGRADLESGCIRVMHSRSFADDPTRVLRALRFAMRFGYAVEEKTESWLREAVAGGYLDTVSGERLRKELALTFGEAPVRGPLRLQEAAALRSVHAGLVADEAVLTALRDLQAWFTAATAESSSGEGEAPAWAAVLACCAAALSPQERWNVVRRLRLSRNERAALVDAGAPWRAAVETIDRAPPHKANSSIERAFRDISVAGLLAGAAVAGDASRPAQAVKRYFSELRGVGPRLDGQALIEIGVAEGPEIGAILQKLRASRLDGEAPDAAAERRLVAGWLAGKRL